MTTDRPMGDSNGAALEREAIAWLMRVTDDDATRADRDALQHWKAQSAAHADAFAKASMIWQAMPSAIEAIVPAGAASASGPAGRSNRAVDRRFLVGGFATAAAAAAAGYLVVRPPLALWPSVFEMAADYRTGTGQQRSITIAPAVTVEMNTQTSIVLHPTGPDTDRFELVSGEAIVGAAAGSAKAVQVIATDGLTTAETADFDVRCDARMTVVTCLSGGVLVEHRAHSARLQAKQQVSYGQGGMSSVDLVDPVPVTSWREGYLMFRKEPLTRVIDEVNRYRAGRIVLLDSEIGRGLVTARFRLDRLDDVVVQVRDVFGARVRKLPGGIVLIG